MSIDEARDIRASLNGDGEAYARLVRRYQDQIARYMWRFTRQPSVWEELVQDVFVEAYFSLGGFKGRSPLGHWLRRVATRVGYRYWKDRRRRGPPATVPLQDCAEIAAAPEHARSPQEAAESLHQLLGQLGPRDRLVLTLEYLEELSVAEIAALTGWTQSMVKVQAHRARRRLRQWLARQERPT